MAIRGSGDRQLLRRGVRDEALGAAYVLVSLLAYYVAHALAVVCAKVLLYLGGMDALRKQLATASMGWVPRLLDGEVFLGQTQRIRANVRIVWQFVTLSLHTLVYL